MTRQLTRAMTINLDRFARWTLTHCFQHNEDLLEVYRWIAVAAGEHGLKWRRRDANGHRRYPNIEHELGLRDFKPYPLSYHQFSLCFTQDSSEYMPKVRQVVTRIAFGLNYDIKRWRKDHGLRECEVPCRVLRARNYDRSRDPLSHPLYFDRPTSAGTPVIRGRPQIKPSFNEIHPLARGLHYFMLEPELEGWRLTVVYGYPNGDCIWLASSYQEGRPLTDQIPCQGSRESANEFFERCRVYAQSILVSEQ
jgi:hypothetical protein